MEDWFKFYAVADTDELGALLRKYKPSEVVSIGIGDCENSLPYAYIMQKFGYPVISTSMLNHAKLRSLGITETCGTMEYFPYIRNLIRIGQTARKIAHREDERAMLPEDFVFPEEILIG